MSEPTNIENRIDAWLMSTDRSGDEFGQACDLLIEARVRIAELEQHRVLLVEDAIRVNESMLRGFRFSRERSHGHKERGQGDMSAKNEAIAESIIRCEGLSFALASKVGKEGDLREARRMLKERILKELGDAYMRGVDGGLTGDAL